MSTARLSTKGRLVIPTRLRKALNLQPGDKLLLTLEDRRLVLERSSHRRARLARGQFGRPVLVAAGNRMPITSARIVG